jgi:hypothetical protein
MRRRSYLVLALLLLTPAFAQANLISAQGGPDIYFLPGEPLEYSFSLLLTGTDAYSSSDLKMQINGGVGPAPYITGVFGDTDGGVISPASLYSGSIWAGGTAGITADPNSIANGVSSGLTTGGGFATPAFAAQNTNGIYVTFTFMALGVPAGIYPITFEGTTMDHIDEEFNVTPVPLQFAPMRIIWIPEPSTYALAAIGVIGLLAFRRRKR